MEDDDLELFEQALAELSAEDVFRGKYGAPNDPPLTSPDEPSDLDADEPSEEDREAVQLLRDDHMMRQAFTGVRRIDASKYHVPPPKQVDVDGAETSDAGEEK